VLEKSDVIRLNGERTHDLTENPHEMCFSDGKYFGNITYLERERVIIGRMWRN
jgi:hypothetical protein